MAKYLKDHVKAAGGTLLLVIDSIGSEQTNQNGKSVRHTSFKIKSTGAMVAEDIFAIKFAKFGLKGAKAGDHVEAFLTPEGWADFRIVAATAESSAPASQSPYQQVQAEQKATASIQAAEEEKAKDVASRIIHGFMLEGYKLGKSPDEAAKDAVLFYRAQVKAVDDATSNPL